MVTTYWIREKRGFGEGLKIQGHFVESGFPRSDGCLVRERPQVSSNPRNLKRGAGIQNTGLIINDHG